MSTTIRPELSDRNKYWIERHRYYELKHFCLQYPIWRKALAALSSLSARPMDFFYTDRMGLIEKAADGADHDLACYILRAVSEGLSYDHLKARFDIPCCKDTYYDRYRRFFWLLNQLRG